MTHTRQLPTPQVGSNSQETNLFELIRVIFSVLIELLLKIQPIKQSNKAKNNNGCIEQVTNIFKQDFRRPKNEIAQPFKNLLRTHNALFFAKYRKNSLYPRILLALSALNHLYNITTTTFINKRSKISLQVSRIIAAGIPHVLHNRSQKTPNQFVGKF
jgi:hypothetical protein